MNRNVIAASNFNCLIKAEGLLKVTDSHVHLKSGNISETVKDTDNVAILYEQEVIHDLSNSGNSDDLERLSRSFTYCKFSRTFVL